MTSRYVSGYNDWSTTNSYRSGGYSTLSTGGDYTSHNRSSKTLYDKYYGSLSKTQDRASYSTPKRDYSTTSSSGYGRTDPRIIRPATRSRQSSMSRETGNKIRNRDSSLLRNLGSNGREYPELNHERRTGRTSPVSNSIPKFHTITSTYLTKPNRNDNFVVAQRNYASPIITTSRASGLISGSKRSTNSSRRISADLENPPYSPSFAQNRTNNNNNEYEEDEPSPRSSGSSRRSDGLQNDDRLSQTTSSSGREFTQTNAGLIGLRNIGNTCFMNSILQCLSNTKPLRDYCLGKKYVQDIKGNDKGKLVEAFSNIIEQIWHPSSESPITTNSFKSKIQKFSTRFSGYEQQDCQEFLRFLIEGIHEDVNRVQKKHKNSIPNFNSLCDESKSQKTWDYYLSKDNSFIIDLFMGQLRSSLQCVECRHISTTFDPFWDLSLPIPKSRGYSDEISLKTCLDNFTREEILDRDERPTCEKCKTRQKMTKKFTIYRFPKILVIHLKRFNEGSRYRQKLSNEVDFPHKLEISGPVSTSPASYNLYAVSNHSGSCYGGHYTAYCKNNNSGRWHSFNDSFVSSMSQGSVQSKEAYVLFYELSSSSRRSHL